MFTQDSYDFDDIDDAVDSIEQEASFEVCPTCGDDILDSGILEGGMRFCSKTCVNDFIDDDDFADEDEWYDDYIDETDFADPGGNSALRAATPDNPRDQPCPTCGAENVLTRKDVALGYQCNSCADRAEGGGW